MTNSEARNPAQAAASQVQGAAEVGADVEALASVIHRTWCNSSHHRTEQCQKQTGDMTRAKAILAAGWVPGERVAEARAEAAGEALSSLLQRLTTPHSVPDGNGRYTSHLEGSLFNVWAEMDEHVNDYEAGQRLAEAAMRVVTYYAAPAINSAEYLRQRTERPEGCTCPTRPAVHVDCPHHGYGEEA